jgi:hypothetical protein
MIQGARVCNRSLPCMATSPSETREELEQELDELEINIKRLRIEYEQFFRGAMKREPSVLRGKVQKVITRFVSDPPRNPAIKFRFNSLNARYQSFRQLWGRTLREMEAGTYAPHKFRMKVNSEQVQEEAKELSSLKRQSEELEAKRESAPGSAFDRLHNALVSARQKTGESTQELTREKLAQLVKKQTELIRDQRGADAKVKFRVVIENNRAKLKATVV